MKILYISECAGSRIHGMAYRKYQFSREFVNRGHEVMLITASFSHVRHTNPDMEGRKIKDEVIDGIRYKWLKTPSYRGNGLGRIRQVLTFNFRLLFNRRKILKEFKPDIVIDGGVMPCDFYFARKIARKAGAKIIYEVGDLWPLSPIELGGYSRKHPYVVTLQFAENYAYKNTDAVVSLLPHAEEHMKQHGLSAGKFNNIPNGIILQEWENTTELPDKYIELIREERAKGNFLVGYAGVHGLANSLQSVIDAIDRIESGDVVLFLVGKGPEKASLVDYVNSKGIKNVHFFDHIPKNSIPSFLKEMDLLFIGLKNENLFRFGISPNKIFDYMMSGKPIVQAINAGNNLVELANCGLYAEPENPEAIADAFLKLKSMPKAELEKLGANGKKYVMENHSYDVLTDRFLNVMEDLLRK